MSFTYENQGTNTYLTYAISEHDVIDSMSLGMLTNNSIPGFVPASFMQMDATKYVRYNVTSKISAAQLFSGPVNKKRLLGVFNGIVDAMLSAEDYMLDPNTILLDMDYIFADVSTCEAMLVCLPVLHPDRKAPDMGLFFKNVIFRTQFDQTENCDHVAKILNYLNSAPVVSLPDFKALLEGISKETAPAPVYQQPAPAYQQPAPQPVQQPTVQSAPQPVRQPVVQSAPQPSVQPVRQSVPQPPVQPARQNVPQTVVPPVQKPVNAPAQDAAPEVDLDNPMTLMYLMQHYSKENKAIYDAQQKALKAQKGQKPQKGATAKAAAKPAAKPAAKQPAPGFAIPGQPNPVNPGFAVPGQNKAEQPKQAQPAAQKPAQPVVQKPVQPVAPPVQPKVEAPAAPVFQEPVYQAPAQPAAAISFGETTVLGGGNIGETTVLGAAAAETPKAEPYLLRVKTGEKVTITKPVFRVGKERSYVDYFISDNTAISRSHANIVNRNGEYFIVDTNSTNHTYVNGGMIRSNVETALNHGAKIRLANEEFEFKMY